MQKNKKNKNKLYYSELSLSYRSSVYVEMKLASPIGLSDNDRAFFQKASFVGVLKYGIGLQFSHSVSSITRIHIQHIKCLKLVQKLDHGLSVSIP